MNTFNIGDKVRCINNDNAGALKKDKIYTVSNIMKSVKSGIDYITYISLKELETTYNFDAGWSIERFELVERPKSNDDQFLKVLRERERLIDL